MKRFTQETPLPQPNPAVEDIGPLVGRNFGGYEVTSYIGEGPSGAVYRAEDLVGTQMAVKVMHPGLGNKSATEELARELKKLSNLKSPLLQTVYDTGYGDEGQFYFVTDELLGCDLEAGLIESGGLAPMKAYEIVLQVCHALEAAHQAGVVHGGLKPRNIFLLPSETGAEIKVLDFGAARLAGGGDRAVVVGNPAYLAPEQLNGVSDARCDIYALGVLMYELFSGSLPFPGGGGEAILRRLHTAPPPPPGVEAPLSRIILSALSRRPGDRPASIQKIRQALEQWAQSSTTLANPVAFQVVRRAVENGASRPDGRRMPDATARMSKFEAIELAAETLGGGTLAVHEIATPGRRNMPMTTDLPDANSRRMSALPPDNGQPLPKPAETVQESVDPNSSESVEASLEDFISQANASFPTADGWDLHTGDVELVDEEIIEAPQGAPSKSSGVINARAPEPLPALPTPAARRIERTEVISQPLPHPAQPVPWTANPLVFVGVLFGAFIVGAGVVFLMVRTLLPTGQPAQVPVVVQAPVAATAAPTTGRPVVTPLTPAAPNQPTVTPIAAAAAQPVGSAAVAVPSQPPVAAVVAPVQAAPIAASATPSPAAPAPRVKHAAAKHTAPAKRTQAPRASDDDDDRPAPKKEQAKPSKKGGDWVDPFAQ